MDRLLDLLIVDAFVALAVIALAIKYLKDWKDS